jgi:transposase
MTRSPTSRWFGSRRAAQGAGSSYKNPPPEPADHALGRSRGGLSTKIHTLADQATATVQVRLTAGQAGDNPQLLPLIEDYRTATKRRRFRLLADKAYSHPSTRDQLRTRKIAHTIPERSDQIARRKGKGSRGGRPPGFDPEAYKKRNTVERGYSRIKQWRGIATRYDKHARTFLGGVLLAASVIYVKTRRSHKGDTL